MMIKHLCYLAILTLPHTSEANWFTDTPLQYTYQALINHQPKRAWQELQISLSQNQLDSRFWLTVKQEILSKTECGQALSTDLPPISNIEISFIRRFGLSSQGYQLKLSSEKSSTTVQVSLISPDGKKLIDDEFIASNQYQEMETSELLIKPPSGVYQLKLEDNSYPIIASLDNNKTWLKLENKIFTPRLKVTPPTSISGCPDVNINWQWFDKNYTLLGNRVPIQGTNVALPKVNTYSSKAKYLSATAELVEYQSGAKIKYVQRVAIPIYETKEIPQ